MRFGVENTCALSQMNIKRYLVIVGVVLYFGRSVGICYEMGTHFDISLVGVGISELNAPATMQKLGLTPLSTLQKFATSAGVDSPGFRDARGVDCRHAHEVSIQHLVACGAMFEDAPDLRSLSHFFDPAHLGAGLTVLGLVLPHWPSPEWALKEQIVVPHFEQMFSFANARKYFYDALTVRSFTARQNAWGATFQSLGQVIHHLQDMAQPQHVRNDAHSDRLPGDPSLGPYNHPSRYERYTLRDARNRVQVLLASSDPAVFPTRRDVFKQPIQFWTGTSSGIADFTNTQFVSQRTNFVFSGGGPASNPEFTAPSPLPDPSAESVASLYSGMSIPPSVDKACKRDGVSPDVYLSECYMTFMASVVTDGLTGAVSTNRRAASYSIFDEDLKAAHKLVLVDGVLGSTYPTEMILSLNRFNFDSAHQYLIPRAASYSAGLINYFFRGEMQVNLPDDGVFAITDTTPGACGAPCGFRTLKLKLRNTTPGGELMGAGQLVAVVKFHRNTCYVPDLSGDFGGPMFLGAACRSIDEEVLASNPVAVDDRTISDVPTSFTFDFGSSSGHPDSTIPINASDVVLQVVFRGKLGEENDAVAVTTLDIAEPNYLAMVNNTDYAFDDAPGHNYFVPVDGRTDIKRIDINNIRLSFAGNALPIATMAKLPGGGHAQVAFLGLPGPSTYTLSTDTTIYANYVDRPFQFEEFTLEDAPASSYSRSCPVFPVRKIYRQIAVFYVRLIARIGGVDSIGGKEAQVAVGATDDARTVAIKASLGSYCNLDERPLTNTSLMSPQTSEAATLWMIKF